MRNLFNFFDGYIEGKDLWFSNLNFNALMKMNIETGETEMIDTFPGFPAEQESLHLRVIKYGDCLYFMPFRSNVIHIWNLVAMGWDDSIKLCDQEDIAFVGALQFDETIWMIPNSLQDPFISFHLMSKRVIQNKKLTAQMNYIYSERGKIEGSCVSIFEEKIALSTSGSNKITLIDCEKAQIIGTYDLGDVSIAGIEAIDNNRCLVWFTDSSDIWRFSYSNNKIDKIPTGIDFMHGKYKFYNLILINNGIVMITPWKAKCIATVDLIHNFANEIQLKCDFKRCNLFPLYLFSKQIDNTIYLFPGGADKMLCVNSEDMPAFTIDFHAAEQLNEYANKILAQQFRSKFDSRNLSENIGWDNVIPDYLDLVCNGKRSNAKVDKNLHGNDIHNEIMRVLGCE